MVKTKNEFKLYLKELEQRISQDIQKDMLSNNSKNANELLCGLAIMKEVKSITRLCSFENIKYNIEELRNKAIGNKADIGKVKIYDEILFKLKEYM